MSNIPLLNLPAATALSGQEWVEIAVGSGPSAQSQRATTAMIAALAVGGTQIYGTAAPTSGTWKQGAVVWNTAANVAGDPLLWYCTVGGSPGTWVAHNL